MEDSYSDKLLEETPTRVTRLLTGIARSAVIRTLMGRGGMRDLHITEGRELLMSCLSPSPIAVDDTDDAKRRREAVASLDAWDEPNFARYRAALKRHYPKVGAYVFDKLTAAMGPEAVKAVATFFQRLDDVAEGRAEDISRTEGRKALALLAERGLTDDERTRLRELIELALGPTEALPVADMDAISERRRHLVALREWYEEWAAVARAEVKRRDHLILLGLAERKRAKKKDAAPQG